MNNRVLMSFMVAYMQDKDSKDHLVCISKRWNGALNDVDGTTLSSCEVLYLLSKEYGI